MKKEFVFLITLLIQIPIFPQLKIDFQLRNRLECRDGYQNLSTPDDVPAVMNAQRTRISFKYENEKFKFVFSPQDVRIWGDEEIANLSGVHGDYASLDMFEGYAEMKLNGKQWLSVGRQQLVYDNEWLFSARNWNNHGNSLDAIVLKNTFNDLKLHLGMSWNTLAEAGKNNFFPPDRMKSLNYVWANKSLSENFDISLLYVATGVTKNDTSNVLYFRHTCGAYGAWEKNGFTLNTNLYYQAGANTSGKEIQAYFGAMEAGYSISKLSFGGNVVYLSGNRKVGADMHQDNLFDILQGARHRYFGLIDYFRVIPSHTKQGGLIDYGLSLGYQINEKISIKNNAHYFMLAQSNSLTKLDKRLGFENDCIFKYKFSQWGDIEAGYLFFMPTMSLKYIQGVPDGGFSQFLYLQLTVKSTIFTQKENK